jgi:hypothetical protein
LTFPLSDADAGDGGPFATISAQCAALPPRPLTAGSYTDPETRLTVHWPDGWTLTTLGQNSFATLSAPVTWVPAGAMAALQDEATFSIAAATYGNADQVPQAVPGAISAAMQAGGAGTAVTLLGQPAALWWELVPPAEPGCASCTSDIPPLPYFLDIAGLLQFRMVDAGAGFGVEVDLAGSARADAKPTQVFCDMEAMILGVTLSP